MSLLKELIVEYQGTDGMSTCSPIFDSINLPIDVPGKLIGQQGITFITFFLVYENGRGKKLMWKEMSNCQLVKRKVMMMATDE